MNRFSNRPSQHGGLFSHHPVHNPRGFWNRFETAGLENPTITVRPSGDTGLVIAGQTITAITGAGAVAGAVAGAMIAGKRHRVIGAAIGLVGGFFAGKWEDARLAAATPTSTTP